MSDIDRDFDSLLEDDVADIKPPKTLPGGTWEFVILSGKLQKGKGDGKGPLAAAMFTVQPISPSDDVSEVELEDFSDEDRAGARVFHKVNVWEKADRWNIVRFLTTIGFDVDGSGIKLDKAVEAAKGYHFTAYVSHRANPEDEERPFVDLKDIAAVE